MNIFHTLGAFHAGGVPIRNAGSNTTNLLVGQPALVDTKTMKLLPLSDLSTLKQYNVAIGTGGKYGSQATAWKMLFPKDVNCNTKVCVDSTPPSCTTTDHWRVAINCLGCDTNIELDIQEQSPISRLFQKGGLFDSYNYKHNVVCCLPCGECETTANCEEELCKLVQNITDTSARFDPRFGLDKIKDWNIATVKNPFWAYLMYNKPNSYKVYCIDPTTSTCGICDKVPALISFNDGTGDVPFNFVVDADGNMDSSNLAVAVDIMNNHMGLSIQATLLGDNVACCKKEIIVSTCVDGFVLKGAKVCFEENPLEKTRLIESGCKNCDSKDLEVPFTCGLGIMGLPLVKDCGCYAPNDSLPSQLRRIQVNANVGVGCAADNVWVYQVSKAQYGFGQGVDILNAELLQPANSRNPVNRVARPFPNGQPHPNDQLANTFASCGKLYCMLGLTFQNTFNGQTGLNDLHRSNTWADMLALDTTDTDGITDWTTFFNGLRDANCCLFTQGEISCERK